MKGIRMSAASVAAAACAIGMAVGVAGPAAAVNQIALFGTQEILKDPGGSWEIGYTVDGFGPSTDAVPHAGELYEATVTAKAIQGWVNPVVPFFNARAQSGANYRVMSNLYLPQGLSGGSIPPGGETTGKVYFDVVGDTPNSVVINDGGQDLMAWVAP